MGLGGGEWAAIGTAVGGTLAVIAGKLLSSPTERQAVANERQNALQGIVTALRSEVDDLRQRTRDAEAAARVAQVACMRLKLESEMMRGHWAAVVSDNVHLRLEAGHPAIIYPEIPPSSVNISDDGEIILEERRHRDLTAPLLPEGKAQP